MSIGLSLLFFILSLMGNLTYGAGVSLPIYHNSHDSHKPRLIKTFFIDHLPLHRKELYCDQCPMADWLARHHGRRRDHLRAVPTLRDTRPGHGCCLARLLHINFVLCVCVLFLRLSWFYAADGLACLASTLLSGGCIIGWLYCMGWRCLKVLYLDLDLALRSGYCCYCYRYGY